MSVKPADKHFRRNGPFVWMHQSLSHRPGEHLVYGYGNHFQISSTEVAMLVNLRVAGAAVVDYENGWDVVVFDDLARITTERTQAQRRNEAATHPRTGQPLIMVQHMPQGGFIPLGSKLPDGRPHPHAGTGFGLGVVHGYPADNSLHNAHVAKDMHHYLLLVQYEYDGTRFRIVRSDPIAEDQLLPGLEVYNRGLGPAIPDGEEMVFGLVAGTGEGHGSGLSRWRYGPNGWRPISFIPVDGTLDRAFEPSVVRDVDGSLLFCVRSRDFGIKGPPPGIEDTGEHFRVCRSLDNGATWQRVIHLPKMRASSPVTINKTADGRLYLAANPYCGEKKDSQGRRIHKQRLRESL